MKDIVERLRAWAEEDVRAIAKDMPVMGLKIEPADVRRWGDLMDEAADEIERLQGIIANAAAASLEWSTGVKSAQETCAEVMSTLMTAAKLSHQPST